MANWNVDPDQKLTMGKAGSIVGSEALPAFANASRHTGSGI
jgi:hypothetical protein